MTTSKLVFSANFFHGGGKGGWDCAVHGCMLLGIVLLREASYALSTVIFCLAQLPMRLVHKLEIFLVPVLCAFVVLCTVKKVNDFPVSSRDVTYQTLPGRE
jgi:hypothetical protein